MRVDVRRHRALLWLPVFLAAVTAAIYVLLHPNYSLPSWRVGGLPDQEINQGVKVDSNVQSGSVGIELHPEEHDHRAPKTILLSWTISKGRRRPDGVENDVYLIDDVFLGPTVEVRQGDNLFIEVHNALPDGEPTAIHWHGLHVANAMDGVPGVTQCEIPAGKSFTYHLQIPDDQVGTYWYHAHSETQRADGLYGSFIVHAAADAASKESEDVEADQVLMVGDWYHRSGTEVLEYYRDWKHWKIEPSGDSMLLNGQGHFNCSMAIPARPVDCVKIPAPSFRVTHARTRLRLINTGSMAAVSLTFTGFSMRPVNVDGQGVVEGGDAVSKTGLLFPGERIDVILERIDDKKGPKPSLTVALDPESLKWPNLALTPEQEFVITGDVAASEYGSKPASLLEDLDLAVAKGDRLPKDFIPEQVDQVLLLYSTISYLARYENRPKGFINHTSWPRPSTDLPLLSTSREHWPSERAPFIPQVTAGSWTDIVLNNLDDKTHPFHLHGHSFYVVSSHEPSRPGAYEAYNPYDGQAPGGAYNLINPLRKDTVSVPARGYVVLRFKADNPGLWLFHCHVAWHQAVGMGMALEVSDGGHGLPPSGKVTETCWSMREEST